MNKNELLRRLPKIDEILKEESLVVLSESRSSLLVTEAARSTVSDLRKYILSMSDEEVEGFNAEVLTIENVAKLTIIKLIENEEYNLYPVINATGTILHTNLGRAPLCSDAIENVADTARGYSNLEYNVPLGKRGSRHDIVSKLIAELTGAEDAMVVNNNAAATMIVLAAMGKGKEIIVSRGELVEIGGAFRIPDIMSQSGAFLQEVGTSNKTKVSDYENAIMTEEMLEDYDECSDPRGTIRFVTGALMKVHKSNYDILGFTEEASLEDLVALGKKHDLPVIFDMGNGLMLDMSEYGLREPNVPSSLATGIDVILFSGDKLLGGPQAGIIAGKKEYIEKMKKHPLARAMRVDKMTFAALEATLFKYRDPKLALKDIPILKMISSSKEDLSTRAEALAKSIAETIIDSGHQDFANTYSIGITEVEDQIGGGSAPMVRLPGWAVCISPSEGEGSIQEIERRLRRAGTPIVARINEDRLLLSLRTIADTEFEAIAGAFS